MQQMLAQYKQQFPGAQPVPNLAPPPPSGFTGAQPMVGAGTAAQPSTGAAATSGTAKLLEALMKAKQQKDLQNQLQNKQNSGQVQGPPIGSTPAMYPDPNQAPPVPVGTVANPGGAF
jgi:hypothetical protein